MHPPPSLTSVMMRSGHVPCSTRCMVSAGTGRPFSCASDCHAAASAPRVLAIRLSKLNIRPCACRCGIVMSVSLDKGGWEGLQGPEPCCGRIRSARKSVPQQGHTNLIRRLHHPQTLCTQEPAGGRGSLVLIHLLSTQHCACMLPAWQEMGGCAIGAAPAHLSLSFNVSTSSSSEPPPILSCLKASPCSAPALRSDTLFRCSRMLLCSVLAAVQTPGQVRGRHRGADGTVAGLRCVRPC